MDFCSLYTNIEIPLGLGAIRRILGRHPDPNRPDDCLMRLLEISLTRNDFVFQNKFYLQVKGTAMGKRFAPAYANIYMAEWEEVVFKKCKQLPLIYLRYLDDIWGIWTHLRKDFDGFVQITNEHHTSIKVEATPNDTEIDFLDITIFKGPNLLQTGTLDTRMFFKPTDSHSLLHKQMNILGTDVDVVESYKYLGVHLNNNLDWSHNTDALVKKGNSRLFLLRRLRSFGVQGPLLRTFYYSVVGSAIFYGIVCWSSSITDRDRKRMDRLVRRASSVLGCPLDSVEVVGNGRMMAKLSSMLNNTSHPLQDTLTALGSSFSEWLLHPRWVKERYCRSFLPAAVRLHNKHNTR
ncbi:hypothetical protein D4764_01G0000060 [Takifugu flavidus]|uniref:Reverse transcriptase domain-containing protein n=1 Tax=Takifugu flavidus TaxID=433684 RepID=A0A5C6PMV5_9TELE|nr:hypothetical protein D4764_01G0000060 [Takifugu flavidus]